MNIVVINSIRRNWLWLTLSLLLFTIFLTRNWPGFKHPLSWWNMCWSLIPYTLGVWANFNSWLIFRPIRWLTWVNTRNHIERIFKKLDKNIMVYPAILWLNFGEAEKVFIRGGWHAFNKAFDEQADKVADGIKKAFTPTPAPANCCGGDCGYHEIIVPDLEKVI